MDSLFYNGWTDKVVERLKISKGLFLACYLADLNAAIQNMKKFKCFDGILEKLSEVDDNFIPTVFEIEAAELIINMFKERATDLEFAGCFATNGDKKIDLRLKVENHWIYFEMTKIMDYVGKLDTLRLYNLACSFLLGAKTLSGKTLELQLIFENSPNQGSIDSVLNEISSMLSKNIFEFTVIHEKFKFSAKETIVPNVRLKIKSDTIANKLKDKYFEELEHFDNQTINLTVIDTTYLPDTPGELIDLTRKIFKTEGDLSPISAVILACKKHVIDNRNAFPITGAWELPVIFNDRCDKYKIVKGLFRFS